MLSAMAETAPGPRISQDDRDDELVHLVCECDPDVALCGVKVPGDRWVSDGVEVERDCVVCLDLEDKPCGCRGCDA